MPSKEKGKEMSLENHPNFHAVNFVVEVMKAYRSSLRGPGINVISDKIGDMVADFTERVEAEVDCGVCKEEPPMPDEVAKLAEKLKRKYFECALKASNVTPAPDLWPILARVALEFCEEQHFFLKCDKCGNYYVLEGWYATCGDCCEEEPEMNLAELAAELDAAKEEEKPNGIYERIPELIRAANVVVDRFANDSLRLRVGDILVLEAALLSLKSKKEPEMNLAEIVAEAESILISGKLFDQEVIDLCSNIPALIAEVERLRKQNEAYGHRVGCLRYSADKEREHLTEKLEENEERKGTEKWLAAELEAAIAQLAAIREKAAPITKHVTLVDGDGRRVYPEPDDGYCRIKADDIRALADALKEAP